MQTCYSVCFICQNITIMIIINIIIIIICVLLLMEMMVVFSYCFFVCVVAANVANFGNVICLLLN